ncbi:carbamoyltransferase family protein [Pseudonocardia charpentierae]|uniref:Carbamoyltransferase C-terminal domain-containing protein n=1 Tax=Pseudonocardia charpentierae TaxID=3075545 RepID=A0ABU2N2H3_9PSEU|nr:carbamoyltransferase C-terminal domain-containing protein [Pseudonocardia sp. DSM 45834]MDT0348122.1 carbamoyltransferase C-terminal domain-containing protein [Pseudonocardia sp. DSM 45834]
MSESSPTVVGLNVGHDGGCAVLADGEIVAIAEERLNRSRYSAGWLSALHYCLHAVRKSLDDVDLVVFSSIGERLPTGFDGGLDRFGLRPNRTITVDHHLSHAYSAYCLSDFNSAVVAVLDGAGNDAATESYYFATDDGLTTIASTDATRPRAGGIGATYEAFTNYIGFHEQEAGKTMALASYGDPGRWGLPLFEVDGLRVEGRLGTTHERGVVDLADRENLDLGAPYEVDSRTAMDLAAWVQSETERAVTQLVTELVRRTGVRSVCVAGGVAMNCVMNERVRSSAEVDLFVPPPASDRGQALGNVLIGCHRLTGRLHRRPLRRDEFGRSYAEAEILSALRRHPHLVHRERHPRAPFAYGKESDPALVAAQLLAEGKLVAWFQGGSELGARALGSRSILADPRTAESRDRLNRDVKKREWFRPFAPAVTAEAVDEWFRAGPAPNPFMLFTATAREEKRPQLEAITHIDGSARLQSVTLADHPLFHRVIDGFGRITGVPVLLNTSFNVHEPIVESPSDALATFQSTALDAMVMGNYLVTKR